MRVATVLFISALLLVAASCAGGVPGWGRSSIDTPAAPDDGNGTVDPTPGAGTDTGGGTTPPPPSVDDGDDTDTGGGDTDTGGGGTAPPPPSAGGGDDDDDTTPPPPPGGGGWQSTIITAMEYDPALRRSTITVEEPTGSDLLLQYECSAEIAVDGAAEELVPGGVGTVQVDIEFVDGEAREGSLLVHVLRQPGGEDVELAGLTAFRAVYIESAQWLPATQMLTAELTLHTPADVTLSLPEGATTTAELVQHVEPGNPVLDYPITLAEGFTSGVALLAAADEHGNTYQRSVELYPELELADDTLYVYPTAATAQVGEPVTVVVATGRPADILQFLTICTVTIEDAGSYVPGSFNIGAPGGARLDSDGLWGAMGIPNGGFLDLGDDLVPGVGTQLWGGRHAYSFAVVSKGPYPALDAAGLLFNFQLSFSAPGTYHLGLQYSQNGFTVTYYSSADNDSASWDHFAVYEDGSPASGVAQVGSTISVE